MLDADAITLCPKTLASPGSAWQGVVAPARTAIESIELTLGELSEEDMNAVSIGLRDCHNDMFWREKYCVGAPRDFFNTRDGNTSLCMPPCFSELKLR